MAQDTAGAAATPVTMADVTNASALNECVAQVRQALGSNNTDIISALDDIAAAIADAVWVSSG